MPIFIITCVYDEGVYESSFVAVEAKSKLDIARHMIARPDRWEWFLDRCKSEKPFSSQPICGTLAECIVSQPDMTPERLLELIDLTSVDGDSDAQVRIYEIEAVPLNQVETDWWKRKDQRDNRANNS